jgi:hypothetical protein
VKYLFIFVATLDGLLTACGQDKPGNTCSTKADCQPQGMSYCRRTACGEDAVGQCEAMPKLDSCNIDAVSATEYVCGCDHQTYDNECVAAAFGVSVAFAGACPPLPSGPCTSQDDCGGTTYDALVFCKPINCATPAGYCADHAPRCSDLYEPLCGCDGHWYVNSCYSDIAGVGEAYSGFCRSGAVVACDASDPCPAGQKCVDDPRTSCAPGASCPGVCLDTTGSSCDVILDTNVQTYGCSNDTACIAPQACDTVVCGECMYSTPTTCDAATPCPDGQLCVPTLCTNAGACPSICIVP